MALVGTLLLLILCSLGLTAHAFRPSRVNAPSAFQWGGIKWIEEGRSVIVKLRTPGLPLLEWDPNSRRMVPNDGWSALLFNFTVSTDNHTLLLFDEPILPVEDVNVPPRLEALRVPDDLSAVDFAAIQNSNALESNPRWPGEIDIFQRVSLDYERVVSPRDDPSIRYWLPSFRLKLNILGAENVLLDMASQEYIELCFEDVQRTQSDNPRRSYNIAKAYTKPREDGQTPYVHPKPHYANACTWWFWRCSDFDDPPWYRFVWRHEFDEYGRIGSLRHSIVRQLDARPHILGVSWVVLMLYAITASGIVFLGLRARNLLRWVRSTPKLCEGEAAQHLLEDLDEAGYEDAPLGPRPGEYLVAAGASTSTVSAGVAPPTRSLQFKPLPQLPENEASENQPKRAAPGDESH